MDSTQNYNSSNALPVGAVSPYFLHHADNPGLVFVSQTLVGENYFSWSSAMLISLSVKNKLGFIDGSITRPVDSDPMINPWIRNNNMVISWILNSVSKEISASAIYCDSASVIWKDLKERFSQKKGPRIYQLRRELSNLTQDQLSVSSYFTKLKTIWEEMSNYRPGCSCSKCTCNGVTSLSQFYETEYVMSFFMGLNESFAQSCAQIFLMDPIPSINKVFSLVVQEEDQRSINLTSIRLTLWHFLSVKQHILK